MTLASSSGSFSRSASGRRRRHRLHVRPPLIAWHDASQTLRERRRHSPPPVKGIVMTTHAARLAAAFALSVMLTACERLVLPTGSSPPGPPPSSLDSSFFRMCPFCTTTGPATVMNGTLSLSEPGEVPALSRDVEVGTIRLTIQLLAGPGGAPSRTVSISWRSSRNAPSKFQRPHELRQRPPGAPSPSCRPPVAILRHASAPPPSNPGQRVLRRSTGPTKQQRSACCPRAPATRAS
jgi:hypothetical protein